MKTDILVIGSGIAGLTFALKASKHAEVAVVTKREAFNSNTADAQGGIAVPTSGADGERHIRDTLAAGRGICNETAVKLMVRNARARIDELLEFGVKFEKDGVDLKRTLEAGHSAPRIVYNADATGRAIEHRLVTLTREQKDIRLIENTMLTDLLFENNRCHGAQFITPDFEIENIFSKFTILATGGCGQLYEKTTNSLIATGDGYAAASRAGAVMENMEFVQFHPTKLDVPSVHPFLISEVLRGEGGVLVNSKHETFMKKYDRKGELAPRDVVARAIYSESLGGQVYLDMTHKSREFLMNRFPTIFTKCLGYDIDLSEDLVPVTAAAHYMCGGVKTDLKGRTSINSLYAVGEVACTGVHGANRLASNSLLEAMVFSHEAFKDVADRIPNSSVEPVKAQMSEVSPELAVQKYRAALKKIMWEKVGLVRDMEELRIANMELEQIRSQLKASGVNQGLVELENMLRTSKLIVAAAIGRKESLGCHYLR